METSRMGKPISTLRTSDYGSTADRQQLENQALTSTDAENPTTIRPLTRPRAPPPRPPPLPTGLPLLQNEDDANLDVITPALPVETTYSRTAAEIRTTVEGYQTIEEDYTSPLGNLHVHLHSTRFAKATRRYTRMTAEKLEGAEPVGFRKMHRFEQFLNWLAQILIGFVVIYMSWFCISSGLTGTSLHAFLATLGFVLLMAEGMMCHYNNNVLTFTYKRTTKTTIHWMLEAVGGLLGVAAVLLKYIGEGFYLQSTHDKLGFSAFIFCLVSMLSGLSSLFSSKMRVLFSPLCNKTLHNLFGFVTYILGMLTYYYGYQFGFFSHHVSAGFLTMIEVITLLAMVLAAIGPIKSLWSKLALGYRSID